jgi:hypothetical protein
MNNKETVKKKLSKKKKFLYSLIVFFISIFIILAIAEIILRIVPIPGIKFNLAKYDTLTGTGYYPNTTYTYRNDRGDFVKRKINKWGYFDKNYNQEKNNSDTRIGFFGDSFTQAVQVPLEETFHYLIGDSLNEKKIETLSFGVSGFSTYQAYLTNIKWTDFFDIDIVVYVFFENDMGDQIRSIKKEPTFPYPLLKDDQLIADNSFKEIGKNKTNLYFKIFDYLTANFLVFATIAERIKLLSEHGVKVKVDEKDRLMNSNKIDSTSIIYPPNLGQTDNPLQWPDSLKNLAINLEKAVLLNWKNQLEKKQKKLVVLYTPKSIKTPATEQNSWKPFLEKFCLENGIPFIDPTDELMVTQQKGNDVFYDHYTKFGHQAVSRKFISWYLTKHKHE